MTKRKTSADAIAAILALAKDRQKVYAARRRVWAKAVGRPYVRDNDPRPPPGEVDAGPDE